MTHTQFWLGGQLVNFKLKEELVNSYRKFRQTDVQNRLSLHTECDASYRYNDFCWSPIPVLWHLGHRPQIWPTQNFFGLAPPMVRITALLYSPVVLKTHIVAGSTRATAVPEKITPTMRPPDVVLRCTHWRSQKNVPLGGLPIST